MFTDLLHSSYFSLFLIVALGFMLGRVKIKGLSLDVSAVIFIALLFGHFGVIIPKELGNFGLVLFIFTIGIQAGPKGKRILSHALITFLYFFISQPFGYHFSYRHQEPFQQGYIFGDNIRLPFHLRQEW